MLRILLASLMFSCASPALANGAGAAPVSKPAPTILIFGDSLSAGHGLANGQSWPSLLGQRLQAENSPYTVVNASISGETTAGGRTRLPAALERTKPAVVIIALGANDGLRGLPVKQLKENLVAMARVSKGARARVLLVGMRLPPNYGPAYVHRFQALFAQVAKARKVRLVPFLLDGVADQRDRFQADGLHPDAGAQAQLMDNVWRELKPMLKEK